MRGIVYPGRKDNRNHIHECACIHVYTAAVTFRDLPTCGHLCIPKTTHSHAYIHSDTIRAHAYAFLHMPRASMPTWEEGCKRG